MPRRVARTAHPAKLVSTSPACHVITAFGSLDAATTLGTLLHIVRVGIRRHDLVRSLFTGSIAVPLLIAVEANFEVAFYTS